MVGEVERPPDASVRDASAPALSAKPPELGCAPPVFAVIVSAGVSLSSCGLSDSPELHAIITTKLNALINRQSKSFVMGVDSFFSLHIRSM